MSGSDLPMPASNADSAPYWQAAREGKLVLQQCAACGLKRFLPRHLCPTCWSDQTQWVEACGRGTVHAVTIVRRAPSQAFREKVPYVVALVDLDEGPRMLTNIVGPNAEQARIGQPVEVTFEVRDNGAVPQFRIAGGNAK